MRTLALVVELRSVNAAPAARVADAHAQDAEALGRAPACHTLARSQDGGPVHDGGMWWAWHYDGRSVVTAR